MFMIICRNVFLKCPYTILIHLFTVEMFLKCPYTILLHLFTFEMFLKCPYTILLYLFTFEMFLKCSYTILAVIRKVLLYKTMDLFLFFSLGLYGPGCTTCGVGVSDIGWIRIRA